MFKRQFYAVDHADNGHDPSSSSDDSSLNTASDNDSADEQDDAVSPSHDSSGEVAQDSEDSDDDGDGEPGDSESEDDEWSAYRDRNIKVVHSFDSGRFLLTKPTEPAAEVLEDTEEETVGDDVGDGMVLRIGGILKCRLCVKVICLSDETMKAHLLSKRHARSVKLLAEGKLKIQLNSDGEAEDETETHAERLERIRRIAEEKVVPAKRKADSGRQRQRKRAKQKASVSGKGTPATPTVETPKSNRKARRAALLANGQDKKSPNATGASPTVVSSVEVSRSIETPNSGKSGKCLKLTNGSNKKSRDVTEAARTPNATLGGPRKADSLKKSNRVVKSPSSLPGIKHSSELRNKKVAGSARKDKVRKRKSLQ